MAGIPDNISSDEIEWIKGKPVYKPKTQQLQTNLAKNIQNNIQLPDASEDEVVLEITRHLNSIGFRQPADWIELQQNPIIGTQGYWLSTQQKRKSKQSEGLPDLFVIVAGTPFYIGLEVKERKTGKKGALLKPIYQPGQKQLNKSKCIRVVRCAQEVDNIITQMQVEFKETCYMNALQSKFMGTT